MSETTTEDQSLLSLLWYGDDESSFIEAGARFLAIFTLGGCFGALVWKGASSVMQSINDPTGEKEVEKARTKSMAKKAKISMDMGSRPVNPAVANRSEM
jgi:hypothetical protein